MFGLGLSRLDRWAHWWTYEGLRVHYRRHLNGGGTWMAGPFVDLMRSKFGDRRFKRAYEWCAGPAFFGFALLAAEMCDELWVSDINPEAIASVEKTVRKNHLEGRVTAICGAGVAALPADAKFDLVVGNPPNYFRLNPAHPQYKLWRDDRRPNDPDWKIHREFYAGIARHLTSDGVVAVSEISAHDALVFLPDSKEPYDIRDRPAIDDFRAMIVAGGLSYEGTHRYIEGPGITAEVMVSTARREIPS